LSRPLAALCVAALALHAAACRSGREPARPLAGDAAVAKQLYLRDGSRAFLARDYKSAAELYARALELEQAQPSLSRDHWRTLVDNLGMAYGISGQLESARETFEYGLSRDPEYPMFHYNLACTYAELGQRDPAIAELELAFRYEANMIEGEELPDPRADSSFARYLMDEEFNRALRRIDAR
jgi:tetratricopeptide (TPR) repeat protein